VNDKRSREVNCLSIEHLLASRARWSDVLLSISMAVQRATVDRLELSADACEHRIANINPVVFAGAHLAWESTSCEILGVSAGCIICKVDRYRVHQSQCQDSVLYIENFK